MHPIGVMPSWDPNESVSMGESVSARKKLNSVRIFTRTLPAMQHTWNGGFDVEQRPLIERSSRKVLVVKLVLAAVALLLLIAVAFATFK